MEICYFFYFKAIKMNKRVRVRFAPSPTGPLHMGGVRTALYNYLFAKKHGGDFLLRIEDTDQTRFVPGAEDYIIESLKWCGIMPNEGQGIGGDYGPYKQSERKEAEVYTQYAFQLVNDGFAYYAFDTSEELEEMREIAKKAKMPNWQYNSITRGSLKNSISLSEDEVKARLDAGEPYTIRIKMPRNEDVRFHDEIRGWVTVNTNNLDDKVLYKSDGMPTYHLANIVDDYLMKITHVIRGEEWLPSAPLHVLLYRYLGWESDMPLFAHLPLLLKPDGNGKLSKRDGDRLGFPVFPLEWQDPSTGEISSGYKQRGYFPESFINMLAFLGWNPGTPQEIFSLDELVDAFTLERVSKSGAKFDPDKTKWFNQQYLRAKSNEELGGLLAEKVEGEYSKQYMAGVANMMKERASFIDDMLEGDYFFGKPSYEDESAKKKWKDNTGEILSELKAKYSSVDNWTASVLEEIFKAFLAEKELGMGAVLPNFRFTVTGKGMGPSMFEIAELLGKEETLTRMSEGISAMA
jgi:glutamyl-tRNA synthetase